MLTQAAKKGRVLVWAVGLVVGAGLLGAAPAEARSKWSKRAAKLASCKPPRTVSGVYHKTCPSNKNRPPLVVTRACCENRAGKRQCHPFPKCPSHSPS